MLKVADDQTDQISPERSQRSPPNQLKYVITHENFKRVILEDILFAKIKL